MVLLCRIDRIAKRVPRAIHPIYVAAGRLPPMGGVGAAHQSVGGGVAYQVSTWWHPYTLA